MFLIFFSLSILQGRPLFFSRWKTSVVTSQVAFLTSRENHIEPDAIQTKLSFPTRYSLQTLVKNMLINKAFINLFMEKQNKMKNYLSEVNSDSGSRKL